MFIINLILINSSTNQWAGRKNNHYGVLEVTQYIVLLITNMILVQYVK